MLFVPSTPFPVLTTDTFGKSWLRALLLEIRNGVALVQIGNYHTVRSLTEIRRTQAGTPSSSDRRA
jgi:hypothetical protein